MSSRLQIGQAAPPIKLYDTELKQRTLKEFTGQIVVLAFFPGAFTAVCTKELCHFRDNLANFESVNAQVLAISVNDPFTNKAFAEQNRLLFPILSDYNRLAIRAYDVTQEGIGLLQDYVVAKRAVFVISPEGFIRWKWVTDNPGMEPPYGEVQHAVDDIGRGQTKK
ncbi:MAG: redoxin domain-containing protein [Candidatus Hermodarchaeota archaeon]|nr:redoxin domain-containing protein [Candidatus Hermodarchaeota archaeon]